MAAILLENIYRRLAIEKYRFTESEFSEQYLGMSKSYFAYTKCCKGKRVSSDAWLNLYGKLTTERQIHTTAITRTDHEFRKQMLVDWAKLYEELAQIAFDELCRRAGVVNTEAFHSPIQTPKVI
jgi:hypothetical protein